jgi:cyclic pyranopterin phosphate synthase
VPDAPEDPTPGLSHYDRQGNARMVDVSAKPATDRVAVARALFHTSVRDRILAGTLPKGDAIAVARVAGIQAAKETSRLIPLCHPLPLTGVEIAFAPVDEAAIEVLATVRCSHSTGVEMEALTAAAIAALALYDMCKGLDRGARVTDVELLYKAGGQTGEWRREGPRTP